MKDLIKDFLEASRDRIKTPITGSFALAFILWNWRPILILLFSGKSIEDKIILINKNYCDAWALLVPFMAALLYVVLVPYIMMLLEYSTKKAIEGRKTHKSTQTLFDLKITKKIAKEEFEIEQERSGKKSISELNDKIASLNTQIDTINAQHITQIENYEKIIKGYKENEEKNKEIIENSISKKELDEIEWKTLNYIDIEKLASSLTKEEKEYFINFCNFYLYGKSNRLANNHDYNTKFEQKFLAKLKDNNEYTITTLGKRLYDSEFLSKTPLSQTPS